MAEETTTTPSAETNAAPEVPDTGADMSAEVEKWKALARKHEARASDNATAAQRLAEIEESNKTEAQKAADAAKRTADERDAALAEAARLRAAVKFGLSEDDLTHLDGIPADKVESLAEWVASTRPAKLPAAPPATGQGNVGKPIGDGTPAAQLQEAIAAATRDGKHTQAIALKRQLAAIQH